MIYRFFYKKRRYNSQPKINQKKTRMIKTFLARYLGLIILAASKDVSTGNRLHYFLEALGKTAVALYLLDQINEWFLENHRFALFLCVALFANIIVGSTDTLSDTGSQEFY